MSTSPNKCEIIARVRWTRVGRSAWEAALAAGGCLGPDARAAVRRRLAQGVYDCRESEVFLYKSGRAGLRGLLEGGKHAALAAGKVLAGGSVLSHLHQYLLQKLELIGDEGIGFHKLVFAGIALQIGDRARRKGK